MDSFLKTIFLLVNFLKQARSQLKKYKNLTLIDERVEDALLHPSGFEIRLKSGVRHQSRRLLFATGLVDELPPTARYPIFLRKKRFSLPLV